ncbi:MAG: hypothetical protein S4CHLAM102_08590 [Chlamydiia bacterium]|nr:hypothetical protein [Chlamydiia bacterium]
MNKKVMFMSVPVVVGIALVGGMIKNHRFSLTKTESVAMATVSDKKVAQTQVTARPKLSPKGNFARHQKVAKAQPSQKGSVIGMMKKAKKEPKVATPKVATTVSSRSARPATPKKEPVAKAPKAPKVQIDARASRASMSKDAREEAIASRKHTATQKRPTLAESFKNNKVATHQSVAAVPPANYHKSNSKVGRGQHQIVAAGSSRWGNSSDNMQSKNMNNQKKKNPSELPDDQKEAYDQMGDKHKQVYMNTLNDDERQQVADDYHNHDIAPHKSVNKMMEDDHKQTAPMNDDDMMQNKNKYNNNKYQQKQQQKKQRSSW